jgi:uncharacterized ferritin-like protein (DUF455 family)
MTNLFERALDCLTISNPVNKVHATYCLQTDWQQGELSTDCTQVIPLPVPGRPDKPLLIDPREVPRRNINSTEGRLALAHSIAHIEFNAINLALDAVYRFQDMPHEYYRDWLLVAAEEALHYSMLSDYLAQHDMRYGDLPAHNGLWEMAVKTDQDVLVRMALVPRVLEARGLDVTPTMISKLAAVGDQALVSILERIFEDEIGHVKIGTFWYTQLCHERKLEPRSTFLKLIRDYMTGAKFGPFETEARKKAGFTDEELQSLMEHF